MESHMVTALMTQTGLSSQASHALLQSKGWDLTSALITFENVKNTTALGNDSLFNDSIYFITNYFVCRLEIYEL